MKAAHGGDIYTNNVTYDFSVNVNPQGPPVSVIKAICREAEEIKAYPDPQCSALIQAISENEHIPREWILCGNGAAELIFLLVKAMKPQKALLLSPTFSEYEQALKTEGTSITFYSLEREKGFVLDEKVLGYLTSEMSIFFLCNPNNPTGRLIDRGLLIKILARCKAMGIFLVVDECFMDFVEEKQEYSILTLVKEYEQLFILKAFTKLYAMAGVRLGYGICQNTNVLERMKENGQAWRVSSLAQAGGIAALKEEDYVKSSLEDLKKERIYVQNGLEELGFNVLDSCANYLFFQGDEQLYEQLLEQGILIRDCSNYRQLEKGDYRIAIKTRKDNQKLLACLTQIKERNISGDKMRCQK